MSRVDVSTIIDLRLDVPSLLPAEFIEMRVERCFDIPRLARKYQRAYFLLAKAEAGRICERKVL